MKAFAVAALLLILLEPDQAAAEDAKAAAQEVAADVKARLGTTAGIREAATGEDFAITLPSSTAFLTVFAQPGATGDLHVQVHQDLDFDGTADYNYQVPVQVSGICANGVISCNAGTWENCATYQWTADDAGRVLLSTTSLNHLAGCYCINSSCGGNLVWSNLGLVMKDLGGGAVGAVQAKKDGYVITQTEIDGPSIVYYGQDASNPTSGGANPQSEYYRNPAALDGDTETQLISQSSDPDSMYSIMLSGYANRGSGHEHQTCSIQRLITVSGPECSSGAYNTMSQQCEAILLSAHNGTDSRVSRFTAWDGSNFVDSGNGIPPRYTPTLTLEAGDLVTVSLIKNNVGYIVRHHTDAGLGLKVNGEYVAHWRIQQNDYTWDYGPAAAKTVTFTAPDNGDYHFELWSWADDWGSGYMATDVEIRKERPYTCPDPSESIHDNCAALANNADCNLQREEVDSVIIYANYSPTFLAPLPSSRVFGSETCVRTITRNWWGKNRTYLCQSNNTFDFTGLGERLDTITGSVKDNSLSQGDFTYTDRALDPETGEWVTSTDSFDLSGLLQTSEECELACKTRKLVEDTQVGTHGPTTEFRTSNQGWDFFYRICENGACPAEPGEEIVKPCGCINEFAEAAAVLTTLDAAGKDLICSDGVPK